ncbi:PREDICTED: uncharacterized protein LOC104757523 isoform X2 [Camelina sativa]|uniref:Uncharacterized protein LOC104757523 isoform X2 n=1 Tax=Camelina sativa TaxID=90675 RepID=A0ABM1R6M8_CAMSA|nr:PREDICTED: uncharacterized protein LOC104757523 isoform X2 [Camelina sativa]
MRIMHWNCQGLKRNPLTISYLKDIRKLHKPDILFLIETKNGYKYVDNIRQDLGFPYSFILPSDGLSGGMAIFWNDTVQVDFLDQPTLNYTDMYISEPGSPIFCLTYVYGDPDQKQRNNMWDKMALWASMGMYRSKPRLVLGDFNDIKSNEEKLGGPQRSETSFKKFRRMLYISGLHELKTTGGKYTWLGHRYSYEIQSCIDRAVASTEWQDVFPKAYVQLLDWIGSDHRPLLVHTGNERKKGFPLFRYDNRWRFNKEIKQKLMTTWNSECHYLPADQFHEALRRCRSCLSKWKTQNINNSAKKIQDLKTRIQQAMEEEYWRTKSRVQWLQAGDKNTKFFHAKTKQRRNYNTINAITDANGVICTTEKRRNYTKLFTRWQEKKLQDLMVLTQDSTKIISPQFIQVCLTLLSHFSKSATLTQK